MTATIAYDRTVSNLIDVLSATGHVTPRSYKKTSVTFHHNAGRLSHQGVLNVWKVRPASAHFDIDGAGAVAQYVKVNEYAWACGNTQGNQSSIHIEMANATLAPGWTVAEATWKNAARLAGWLHFKVIGKRPTKSTVKYHHDWTSTACAGPYMDKIYDKLLKATQEAYDSFKTGSSSPKPTTSANDLTAVARDVIKGEYGDGPERVRKLLAAGHNPEKVQDEVNRIMSPKRGTKTFKWGNDPQRSEDLKEAGYNPKEVQRQVNLLVQERRRR